jgi:hypothetical protein
LYISKESFYYVRTNTDANLTLVNKSSIMFVEHNNLMGVGKPYSVADKLNYTIVTLKIAIIRVFVAGDGGGTAQNPVNLPDRSNKAGIVRTT